MQQHQIKQLLHLGVSALLLSTFSQCTCQLKSIFSSGSFCSLNNQANLTKRGKEWLIVGIGKRDKSHCSDHTVVKGNTQATTPFNVSCDLPNIFPGVYQSREWRCKDREGGHRNAGKPSDSHRKLSAREKQWVMDPKKSYKLCERLEMYWLKSIWNFFFFLLGVRVVVFCFVLFFICLGPRTSLYY